MTLLVVNNGELRAGELYVGKASAIRDLIYRLFATNITPAETDVTGTYTEAAGGGYAQKSLAGASWSGAAGAPTVMSFARQDWVFTGPLSTNPTIYGYYAVRATDLDLMHAETLAAPVTPTVNGDELRITPQITFE